MTLVVRQMELEEVGIVIDYFYNSSPEHLDLIGVDRGRFPSRQKWLQFYDSDYAQSIERRQSIQLVWELQNKPVGFSTADKIEFGHEAYMHLHVTVAELRGGGIGAACLRKSVEMYFDLLNLERLLCEPNAFNVAPNRALQRAGFKYVKTHNTVPGPLNFNQAVTRWALNRAALPLAAG